LFSGSEIGEMSTKAEYRQSLHPSGIVVGYKKQGINFLDAQVLWHDPDYIIIPAKTFDEPRFLVIGKIEDKHWSGVVTEKSKCGFPLMDNYPVGQRGKTPRSAARTPFMIFELPMIVLGRYRSFN
jgi:hypothetical protein